MMRLVTLVIVLVSLTAACRKQEAADPPAKRAPAAPAEASATGRVDIVVTDNGFETAAIHVKRGVPVTLAFTRKTDKTCATEVVLELGDGQKIEKPLPLDQLVEIPATFARSGHLRYACAMDMIAGVITVD